MQLLGKFKCDLKLKFIQDVGFFSGMESINTGIWPMTISEFWSHNLICSIRHAIFCRAASFYRGFNASYVLNITLLSCICCQRVHITNFVAGQNSAG